jgi:hypothetical protein
VSWNIQRRQIVRQVVVVQWRDDADPKAVEEFLACAPRVLARGPFVSCVDGPGKKVVDNTADWAFIAELAEPEDLHRWLKSEAHGELLQMIMPIKGSVTSIQI